MKLIGAIVGALIVLVITILTPWPGYISGIANELMAIPESAGDIVWEYMLKAFTIGVGYMLFPLIGGCIGILAGYIINRRYG
jgi:hypothetical protein